MLDVRWLLVSCSLVLAACGSDPADVAGNYSIALTNGANGCDFENWDEGATAQNIDLTVTQDGENASATVGGLAGAYLEVVLGSRVYQGTVDGDHLHLQIFGTPSATEGNCTWTVNSTVRAELDGDVLTGTIDYTKATNGNPDCAAFEGCVTRQNFNGTRPPTL
ncbi:MAG TPA: hypothetical protein VML75_24570 [Kofleriaceae bacterium]|nr:hypothetical protein [Kofleriaceae bacterium]